MSKVLSAEQVRQWEECGYIAPLPVMSPGEISSFRKRLETLEERHPDADRKLHEAANVLAPWLYDLTCHPSLLDIVEDLLGPNILCMTSDYRFKNPGDDVHAGWHQDKRYAGYEPVWLTGALAISDCTAENGCLRVIPGSHDWGLLSHEDTADDRSILSRGQRITVPFDDSKAVAVELKAGEGMIFSNLLIHGSGPNRSNGRRIIMIMYMCPPYTKPPRMPGSALPESALPESAALVRGVDTHGHFDRDLRPAQEFGPEELARHRKKVMRKGPHSFVGSDRMSRAIQ